MSAAVLGTVSSRCAKKTVTLILPQGSRTACRSDVFIFLMNTIQYDRRVYRGLKSWVFSFI